MKNLKIVDVRNINEVQLLKSQGMSGSTKGREQMNERMFQNSEHSMKKLTQNKYGQEFLNILNIPK